MTASNHAMTGAAIALAVKEPWLAVPLAFASHFVLDYIPHFGFEKFGGYFKHKKGFHRLIRLDALLLACFLIFLFVSGAPFLAFICAFVACSPDLAWVYRYSINERFGQFKPKPMNWFNRWHVAIQTHIMKGFYIEIPYGAAVLCYVIFKSV
jgi:hypothetical protein